MAQLKGSLSEPIRSKPSNEAPSRPEPLRSFQPGTDRLSALLADDRPQWYQVGRYCSERSPLLCELAAVRPGPYHWKDRPPFVLGSGRGLQWPIGLAHGNDPTQPSEEDHARG